METYVTSLNVHAKVSHIGNEHRTACDFVFMSQFRVTRTPTRPVCKRCRARRATDLVARPRDPDHATERDMLVVALLRDGHDNIGVAARLHVGLRTAVKWMSSAQRRSGAATRFQFGHAVGSGAFVPRPTRGHGWEQMRLF